MAVCLALLFLIMRPSYNSQVTNTKYTTVCAKSVQKSACDALFPIVRVHMMHKSVRFLHKIVHSMHCKSWVHNKVRASDPEERKK
jgi:hypothetical protein